MVVYLGAKDPKVGSTSEELLADGQQGPRWMWTYRNSKAHGTALLVIRDVTSARQMIGGGKGGSFNLAGGNHPLTGVIGFLAELDR